MNLIELWFSVKSKCISVHWLSTFTPVDLTTNTFFDLLINKQFKSLPHNDRFGQVLPNLYKSVFEELKIDCVTDDMLEQCSQRDDIDDGWMLLYLIRRLLWRFAFASKRFALQMTETCYIDCLLSDLNHLSKTPLSNWNVIYQFVFA